MTGTKPTRLGQFVETAAVGERVRAFLPPPLPPAPPLDLQGLFTLYDAARGAIGRLDGVTTILPSTPLFLYMYVRKPYWQAWLDWMREQGWRRFGLYRRRNTIDDLKIN